MHETVMTDELASSLGSNWIKDSTERGCHHCGYNIPNGQTVWVESLLPLDNLTEGNKIRYVQWKVYHPLCVAQKALFTVQNQLPNHQTPQNDPCNEENVLEGFSTAGE